MASVSSPVLVGRDAELARLLEVVEAAATGRPQLVVVAGDAGIGKSRLVAEAIARARSKGSLVLVGACLDIGEAGIPYLPIAAALRSLARGVDPATLDALLGPTRDELATIAPELAASSDGLGGVPAVGSVGQARLFERVLELLGRLGADRPAVVVLEDVQWIDRASRDLVTFLARNLSTERVAAFLTVRTDDLPRDHPNLGWLAELVRAPGAARLALAPLDRAGVAGQVAAIEGVEAADELVDRIWRRSEGNPFFAEELLAADEGGPDGTLLEILAARLQGLDATTRKVVVAVALAGRAVDERLIAAAVELPLDAVRSAVRRAIERHVLREEPSGAVGLRHGLLRDVAAGQLLVGERRDVHERLARALMDQPQLRDSGPAAAAAELAHHWGAAGRIPEAYAAATEAARAAEAVYAHADAHREYGWAIELERDLPDDRRPSLEERLELRRRAAETADLAGELERAIELTTEALDLAGQSGDPVAAGLLHARLGYLRWATGDAAAALDEHRTAVALVPAEPATAARARVLGGLAGSLMGPGGYPESMDLARAAIDCARAASATAEEARARNVLGLDLVALGELEAGIEELRRSRDLAAAAPADLTIVAHYNLGLALAEAGLLDEALEEAHAGRALARRSGLERRFGFDLAGLAGDALLRLGRWAEAEEVTANALRLDRERRASPFLLAVRGRLEALRGDVAAARGHLARARELGAGEDPDLDAYVSRGEAEAALAAGQPQEALAAVDAGLGRPSESHAPSIRVSLLALGARALADVTETRGGNNRPLSDVALRERLESEVARVDRGRMPPATALLLDLAEAELTRAAAPRPTGWEQLADRFDGVGDRYLGAWARVRAAEAQLRASGTRGDAGRYLRPAATTASELGAGPLEREIAGLARRARISLEGAVPAGDGPSGETPSTGTPRASTPQADGTPGTAALRRAGLSAREIEVLRLVAAGRTNGEIAERLFIARKTAGVHVTHILDKLDVANRVEAARVAARLGLEPEADD